MKLTNILWPEVFKGTRGPKLQIELLKDLQNRIEFLEEGIQVEKGSYLPDLVFNDPNATSAIILATRHLREKAPNYHICEDFCKALQNIPDREVPFQFLPSNFLGYISFPRGVVTDTTDIIAGAYVYLGEIDEKTPLTPNLYGKRGLWIGYFAEPPTADDPRLLPGVGRMACEINENMTVADLIAQFPSKDYMSTYEGLVPLDVPRTEEQCRIDLTKLILNILLYLNSQDPEILKLTPAFGKSMTQAKKQAEGQQGFLNLCTVPVHAINWSYQKINTPRETHETFVDTFPRWQRCGVGFSQIKLIWVREHTRTYNR